MNAMMLVIALLTRDGALASGQNDSGIGQCPIGTPVFGLGLTYMSLRQECHDVSGVGDAVFSLLFPGPR